MKVSRQLSETEGVIQAIVSMATPMNKELLANMGMLTDEAKEAGSNDLVIAVQTSSAETCNLAAGKILELMRRKAAPAYSGERQYTNVSSAVRDDPLMQMAIISTAGQFVARETMQALKAGINVMIFSDNVPLEEEIKLKQYAHKKNLLIMGPDCGTAIIGGVGLCFANKLKRGNIGLAAASGTGLQEVTSLIDRFGGGISQAIGVGGRDLSADVGGIMMMDALKLLSEDINTEIVVIISKPPHPKVRELILSYGRNIDKKVIVCFIGDSGEQDSGLVFASSLEDAAVKAVKYAKGMEPGQYEIDHAAIHEYSAKLSSGQKYIRALYCGGTLAAEAEYIMRGALREVYSNISKKEEYRLKDPMHSDKHSIIDLGDDLFTVGRPHPMIDPTVRLGRLQKEAEDPSVAVLLMDFELGYGSHPDPVGSTLNAIHMAQETTRTQGRNIIIIGYILGTEGDEQNLTRQTQMLRDSGVIVASSNLQAVRTAVGIVEGRQSK